MKLTSKTPIYFLDALFKYKFSNQQIDEYELSAFWWSRLKFQNEMNKNRILQMTNKIIMTKILRVIDERSENDESKTMALEMDKTRREHTPWQHSHIHSNKVA